MATRISPSTTDGGARSGPDWSSSGGGTITGAEAAASMLGIAMAGGCWSMAFLPSLELGDEGFPVVEQDRLRAAVAGEHVALAVAIDVREAHGDHHQVGVGPGQRGQAIELRRIRRRVATGQLDHLQNAALV